VLHRVREQRLLMFRDDRFRSTPLLPLGAVKKHEGEIGSDVITPRSLGLAPVRRGRHDECDARSSVPSKLGEKFLELGVGEKARSRLVSSLEARRDDLLDLSFPDAGAERELERSAQRAA
jgi:hypothetical protein